MRRDSADVEDDVMVSVKVAAFAGCCGPVQRPRRRAADMPQLTPPMYVPPIEDFAGGWYLRGDIGMSNQRVKSLFNVLYDTRDARSIPCTRTSTARRCSASASATSSTTGCALDVTGEYRGKANFHGFDIVRTGGGTFTDEYRGSKSEWLVLANAYVDLGTWYSFTPFIGAGIGGSRNTISNFLDVCTTVPRRRRRQRRRQRRSGISPGRCTPASPTR